MTDIKSQIEYDEFIESNRAALFYFSTPQCNVCKVLKPKVQELLNEKFPKIKMAYVDCETMKEVAAQNRIFAVPTILVFIDGKEFLRKSRNISLLEFSDELERPYSLYFGLW
ncbi:MAG: thioredoxin family protein [Ignavibacteriales bacterium]|jgi:thioredoxin 1|nr:thioredoxin family protein [Ignavibacteriales bacterium]MBK7980763.1 thioredoxin family protein [Ignavibacteriota bacterium]